MTQRPPDPAALALEEAPVAVLVSEPGTGQVLYLNRLARALFLPAWDGQAPADYRQMGLEPPCPDTPRERTCRQGGRLYRVSARDMDWGGRAACVEYATDITDQARELDDANQQLHDIIGSIPGGLACYRLEGDRLSPEFISEGVMALSGHTREEFDVLIADYALVYERDRARVRREAEEALLHRRDLDMSYRVRHSDGSLVWVHLNGRYVSRPGQERFYTVFTGMPPEARLFQSLVDETADELYVIDRENYDLLYANETKPLFLNGADRLGQKCYAALHGRSEPCAFCTLRTHPADGTPHPMDVGEHGRFFTTRFREMDWNGIPAYVKFVRDVTEEVQAQRERERLEQYFQTVVKHLSGGVAVVCLEKDGRMTPEFLSEGFAAMTGMGMEEAWRLYQADAMAGVHPDDRQAVAAQLQEFVAGGESRCEQEYRLRTGSGGYIWVKNTLSLIRSEDGVLRVYAGYHDMTREREEKEQLRRQYNELIMQHYRITDPSVLVVGHCNVTQNKILEIIDYTDSDMLATFGSVREEFFTGVAGLVVDEDERQAFKDRYLNAPSLAAYARKQTEVVLTCFIQLPKETRGRYAQFKVNLVETPDTGDVTGILTVTDVTEQTISDLILHRLSVSSYDLVMDVDLAADRCTILSGGGAYESLRGAEHSHSTRVAYVLEQRVLPKDRDHTARMFEPAYMLDRLSREGSYSFTYSMTGERGEVVTKKLNVSAIDLRLSRVCLARTDITDSLKEQQGLLNAMAYTFEQLALIDVATGWLKLYTRQAVLENLPPYAHSDYCAVSGQLAASYGLGGEGAELEEQFRLDTMLRRLADRPGGYDFVTPFRADGALRYKQINVLWGDEKHQTVCMVRADVTDMLAAERQHKRELEDALTLAEEASRAKSDFLSSMSHDIRTPMNAVIGMTTLARAHADDPRRVADCLDKIAISSEHLLSLINDILDMSKIEQAKITLNRMRTGLGQLTSQLSASLAWGAIMAESWLVSWPRPGRPGWTWTSASRPSTPTSTATPCASTRSSSTCSATPSNSPPPVAGWSFWRRSCPPAGAMTGSATASPSGTPAWACRRSIWPSSSSPSPAAGTPPRWRVPAWA